MDDMDSEFKRLMDEMEKNQNRHDLLIAVMTIINVLCFLACLYIELK